MVCGPSWCPFSEKKSHPNSFTSSLPFLRRLQRRLGTPLANVCLSLAVPIICSKVRPVYDVLLSSLRCSFPIFGKALAKFLRCSSICLHLLFLLIAQIILFGCDLDQCWSKVDVQIQSSYLHFMQKLVATAFLICGVCLFHTVDFDSKTSQLACTLVPFYIAVSKYTAEFDFASDPWQLCATGHLRI